MLRLVAHIANFPMIITKVFKRTQHWDTHKKVVDHISSFQASLTHIWINCSAVHIIMIINMMVHSCKLRNS